MIKAMIIDDESDARQGLKELIRTFKIEISILDEANNVIDGLKKIKKHQPELVFLDINMPVADGFDLLEMVDEKKFLVIFTTAHEEYAIKAFRANAIDYLLKPIDPDELINAIEKVNIQLLQKKILRQNPVHKLKLSSQNEVLLPDIDTIIHIEAEGRYSQVYMQDGKKSLVTKNLGEFEKILENHAFIRIHKSHLINLKYILRVNKKDGTFVEMINKKILPVSRRHKKSFFEAI